MQWSTMLLALVVALAIGWYFSYTAARLDRLHARVEGSLAALDAQLIRRAEIAMEVAQDEALDPASAMVLASAASEALEAAEETLITSDVQEHGLSAHRCTRESALTSALRIVSAQEKYHPQLDSDIKRRLRSASERVVFAHRFHNEAVIDARRVRARYVVRFCHLAGHTALPHTVDFED